VLEEESAGVAVALAVVGVSALVEALAEHVATQNHAAVHQDARQLAEFDIGQTGASEGEAAAVADSDVTTLTVL